jgi:hypothetical protein
MEKIINYLPLSLLSVFVLKLIFFGTNAAEMGIVFALTAYSALRDYSEKHKKMQEVIEIVNKQNEVINKMATELDAIKTSMVGLKMHQGFKKAL